MRPTKWNVSNKKWLTKKKKIKKIKEIKEERLAEKEKKKDKKATKDVTGYFGKLTVRLGVEFEYYSNILYELRGLTL